MSACRRFHKRSSLFIELFSHYSSVRTCSAAAAVDLIPITGMDKLAPAYFTA